MARDEVPVPADLCGPDGEPPGVECCEEDQASDEVCQAEVSGLCERRWMGQSDAQSAHGHVGQRGLYDGLLSGHIFGVSAERAPACQRDALRGWKGARHLRVLLALGVGGGRAGGGGRRGGHGGGGAVSCIEDGLENAVNALSKSMTLADVVSVAQTNAAQTAASRRDERSLTS